MSVATAVPAVSYSRRHAAIAGAGLLLMAVLAGFGNFIVVEGLVVDGDTAATRAKIAGSEQLFGLGVLAMLGVALLDVVVAWAMYVLFAATDRSLSLLAGWLRLAYACVFVVAVAHLATTDVTGFRSLWDAGLLLFGASLVAVGVLVGRSRWLPAWLGVLVGVSGIGYVVDSILVTLGTGAFAVSSITFLGELVLAVLLVVKAGWPQAGKG